MSDEEITWIIYYGDGTTFDSSMGRPEDASPWDIQVIAEVNEEVGRVLHTRSDYYLFVDGKWVGVDYVGLVDYLANVFGIVKVGRMADRQAYRNLLERARVDPGLPPKSGRLQSEN